jgi:TetR/AcrR family transcriptional repressor of nem operon
MSRAGFRGGLEARILSLREETLRRHGRSAESTPERRERFAMRYRKDQKQATRQRILEAAGRRFKQDGVDGAGVATVMSDAGLTNGAFSNHFTSKEDLVANVLADQLRAQRHRFDAQPSARAGLDAFIGSYLSRQHRDQCAEGCPSAALLDEIARRPPPPDRSSPTN